MHALWPYLIGALVGAAALGLIIYMRSRAIERALVASVGNSVAVKQSRAELMRFRAAAEISGDSIYITDRATMRFVDVTETAAQRSGYTREELLQMGPEDFSDTPRADLERYFDAAIAAGAKGTRFEHLSRLKDGTKIYVEI